MKPENISEKPGVTALDLRIAVSVAICCLTATLLNHFGVKFPYGEMKLEIIQKMTACIACLLCCQDSVAFSKRAGINRMIITVIGGFIAVLVVIIDQSVDNEWLMVVLVTLGTLLSLVLCKAAKVPYINARIGAVTFILVSCTLNGTARIPYAIFRLISTCYGALVVMLVTWIMTRSKEKDTARK